MMIRTIEPVHCTTRFSLVDLLPAVDLSQVGHLFSFTVTSWSMFPTLLKGDVIAVTPAESVRIGDIVIFQENDSFICHRVRALGNDGEVHTQGDGAGAPDHPIRRRDILSTVTGITRDGTTYTPLTVPPASPADRLRMCVDLDMTALASHLHDAALTAAAFLKRPSWVRRLLRLVLGRYVRVYAGARAPIRAIRVYHFTAEPALSLDRRSLAAWRARCATPEDLLLQARIGRFALGTLHLPSGELSVRRVAAGLGLEEFFLGITAD